MSLPLGGFSTSGATTKTAAAKAVRPRRDFDALKRRRLRAAGMFRRGKSQADVARTLDVSAQTASQWYPAWSDSGRAALGRCRSGGTAPSAVR